LRLAYLAEEGAERALNPVDPFHHGSGASLALSLYREALFWALQAQPEATEAKDLPSAWEMTEPAILQPLLSSSEEMTLLEQHLVRDSFQQNASLPEPEQRRTGWLARRLVGALIERAEGAEREVRHLVLQRWTRSFAALMALLVLIVSVVQGVQRLREGPNLAAGKAWKASSAYSGFVPSSHLCDGNETKILFHTNEEERPWFEVDLGASTTISTIDVTNRTDGFQERAVPLVLEVSEDHNRWYEVARRNETFNHWRAKFPPRKARYVRAKAQRKTFLHLEGVAVRAR
jgi:hypothetical protein